MKHAVLRCGGVAWALACLTLVPALSSAATELPQTGIAYTIEARLDPETRQLDGQQTIRWRNPSSAPVETIPLHLYLNGFAHEETTWMRGAPRSFLNLESILESHDDPWGFIEPLSIRQGGLDLDWRPIAPDDGNPLDRSLIEVALAAPLAPGGTADLEIVFEARLPIPMARTGGHGDFFLVAQWFPKVAVFEIAGTGGAPQDRWNAHQFHGPTEFYADYADYDVRVGVPAGWQVVSTGKGGPEEPSTTGATVWHRYRQRAVHDFAWCASSTMVDVISNHQPPGEAPTVELHVFVPEGMQHQVPRWRRIAEASLDLLASRVGPYPYETLTIITPPHRFSATFGMEYPTLVTADSGDPIWDSGPLADVPLNEGAIAHEIAHQYFYGVVGTNEFEEAYLDEGMSEYWGHQIALAAVGKDGNLATLFGRGLDHASYQIMGLHREAYPRPVWAGPSYLSRHSGSFSQYYVVPSVTFETAAELFGQDTVDAMFAGYYRRWSFGHPRFEDFLQAVRDFGSDAMADLIVEAFTRTQLPDYRVASVTSRQWFPPRGRYVADGRVIEPDDEEAGELSGLEPAAFEQDGKILMRIHDPGWTHGTRREAGSIQRRSVIPEVGEPDPEWQDARETGDDTFYQSTVRVEGAGWDHLPVEVVFTFADGAVLRETWDGRSGYRLYRFLRPAQLTGVAVDPARRIVLDPDRSNNALRRRPDKGRAGEWSLWLGGLVQLLLEGFGQWL